MAEIYGMRPHPAFGWETAKRAGFMHISSELEKKNEEESGLLLASTFRENYKKHVVSNNLNKIFAYIPVVGTVIGVVNICKSASIIHHAKNKEMKELGVRHLTRSIIETLSLGPILFIIDLAKFIFEQVRLKGEVEAIEPGGQTLQPVIVEERFAKLDARPAKPNIEKDLEIKISKKNRTKKTYAKEVVECKPSVDIQIAILGKKRQALLNQIRELDEQNRLPRLLNNIGGALDEVRTGERGTPAFSQEENEAEQEIERLRTQLGDLDARMLDLQAREEKWFPSTYFRELLNKWIEGFSKEKNSPEALEAFRAGVNRKYQHGCVNRRLHRVMDAEGEQVMQVMRLGMITDLSNGYTNLKELKEAARDPAKVQAIRTRIDKAKGNKAGQAAVTKAYALEELQDIPATLKKRRDILSDGFLEFVLGQIEANADQVEAQADGGFFKLLQVSLLNEKSKSVDPSGWVHDEENEMLDMAEIFKEFDGKELIFDGAGPWVDTKGNIHLPYQLLNGKGGPKKLKLRAHMVNVSVQGEDKGMTVQNQMNQAVLDSIEVRKDNAHYIRVNSNAAERNPETSFDVANTWLHLGLESGYAVSVNCASAKDRTGELLGLQAYEVAEKAIDRDETVKENKKSKLKNRARKATVFDGSVTVQVIKENTPEAAVMKVMPNKVKGLNNKQKTMLGVQQVGLFAEAMILQAT